MASYSVGFIDRKYGVMDVARIIERTYCTFTKLRTSLEIPNFYQLEFEIEGINYSLTISEKYDDKESTGEDEVTCMSILRHPGNGYGILKTVVMAYGGKIKCDEGYSDWEIIHQRDSKIVNMKLTNNKELKVSFL